MAVRQSRQQPVSWNMIFTPLEDSQLPEPDFYVGLILVLTVAPSSEYFKGDETIALA